MKKKHGWVIQMKKNSKDYPGFYIEYELYPYSGPLRTAFVCENRRFARQLTRKDEIVRKVELFKNGKAKKIIGKG